MMHRMLWWIIIIIISFLHWFDLFCKTFCTKIDIRSSKGFKKQDKGCSKSKRDQPSLSCVIIHAVHFLDFLRRGGEERLLVLWYLVEGAKSIVVQRIQVVHVCFLFSSIASPPPLSMCLSHKRHICL
jgi:hypothetical protein